MFWGYVTFKTFFPVHYLTQGEKYTHLTYNMPPFEIFCYSGKPKYLIHIWQSVVVGQGFFFTQYLMFKHYSFNLITPIMIILNTEVLHLKLFSRSTLIIDIAGICLLRNRSRCNWIRLIKAVLGFTVERIIRRCWT